MEKEKLENLSGVSHVVEVHNSFFLHPDIEADGDLFLATVYGVQTLVMVKDRKLGNADGSNWFYPGQKVRTAYYLSSENEWFDLDDLS